MLAVRVTSSGDSIVVHLDGDLDLLTVGRVRHDLAPLMADGAHLVLDLARVSFIDSAGIGLLLSTRSALLKRGGRLEIRNPSNVVRRIFDVTGLIDLLLGTGATA